MAYNDHWLLIIAPWYVYLKCGQHSNRVWDLYYQSVSDRRYSFNHLEFTLKLEDSWLCNAVVHKSLIRNWWCSSECKYLLVSELPKSLYIFELNLVWTVIHYQVVLVQDNDFIPWSLLVKHIDWGYCDTIVNNCKFLCCLNTKELIRLYYCNFLSQSTEILCNHSLHPCLTGACWRNNNNKLFSLWKSDCCECGLILTMSVLLHFVANFSWEVKYFIKSYLIIEISGLLLIEFSHIICSHLLILDFFLSTTLNGKCFPFSRLWL